MNALHNCLFGSGSAACPHRQLIRGIGLQVGELLVLLFGRWGSRWRWHSPMTSRLGLGVIDSCGATRCNPRRGPFKVNHRYEWSGGKVLEQYRFAFPLNKGGVSVLGHRAPATIANAPQGIREACKAETRGQTITITATGGGSKIRA